MTGFRWIALLAVVLLAGVIVAAVTLRSAGTLRSASEDAAGKPAIAPCDPPGQIKGERSPECPQAAPPTARTP
ncbi:molecular chaperone-like protein [Methylobacterium nigriterrae]|uniref:molecular chaperone-like protein n=1 Tax=Methylobacterium nigriterrae TaxID=3127512 RepID=UPI003013DC0A